MSVIQMVLYLLVSIICNPTLNLSGIQLFRIWIPTVQSIRPFDIRTQKILNFEDQIFKWSSFQRIWIPGYSGFQMVKICGVHQWFGFLMAFQILTFKCLTKSGLFVLISDVIFIMASRTSKLCTFVWIGDAFQNLIKILIGHTIWIPVFRWIRWILTVFN